MKLLITGDWHIRSGAPERRIDDYWKTTCRKIDFILKLAEKNECKIILQPGDFFDSHRASDFLKRYMIKRLRKRRIKVITVFGQHDLRYHSSVTLNTPLSVLNAAEVVFLAEPEPMMFDNVHIYGASWYEDIPDKVIDPNTFNILIAHKMVIENEKIWEGQEDYELGNIWLRTLPFDLIVAGDNHNHFTMTHKNKMLINCGSLLRSNIDQIDHEPVVYIYDIDRATKSNTTGMIDRHYIPCAPFEGVFNMKGIEEEKQRILQKQKMEAFIDTLKEQRKPKGLDFRRNLHTLVQKMKTINEIDSETLEVIEEVMKE